MDSDRPIEGRHVETGGGPDWKSWLAEHGDRLLLYARQRTSCEADAEDVLQEVFIKLYRQPPTGVRAARAYLFRMARNSALDVLRRQLLVEGDEAFDLVPEDAPPDGSAGLRMDLEAALRCLSVNDRQIVTLHTLGGLRFREIAELMHMPLGTVLWRYRRAIERLRELL